MSKSLEKIDFYLDINHEDEIANIIQVSKEKSLIACLKPLAMTSGGKAMQSSVYYQQP